MTTDGWLAGRLREFCESVDYGYTASASADDEGPKFLRITDIVPGYIDWEAVPYCEADAAIYRKYRLNSGDIVIARTGASTGASAWINEPPKSVFASYLVRLQVSEQVDSRFVSYWLKSEAFMGYVHAVMSEKSAQPNASATTLTNAPVSFPPLPEQRAIAGILGALDDKIALNRQMNATLEGIARALFQSWFVDFDPVRAKAEGRAPDGLDAETAALFPDSFEDSALGPVPSGWRVSTIGEEVRVVGGSTPSTKEPAFWEDGEFAWATPKDLSDLSTPALLSTSRQITELGLAQISSGLLPVATVLLSSRAPVGYLAIAEIPVAINQGFIAMICEQWLSNHYVLWWATLNMDAIKAKANGTTFQEVSKSSFRPIPVLVPSDDLMRAFDEIAGPLYQQVVHNECESRTLAELRDALLPKLVSGELRVGYA